MKIRYVLLSLLPLLFSCMTVPVETLSREFDTSGMKIREQIYLDMTADIYQAVNFRKLSPLVVQWHSEQKWNYMYGRQKFVSVSDDDNFRVSIIYDKSQSSPVALVKEVSFDVENTLTLTAPEQGDNPKQLPLPLLQVKGQLIDFTVYATRERASLRKCPYRLFPRQFTPGEVDDISKALYDRDQLFQLVGSNGTVYASMEKNILTILTTAEDGMMNDIMTTARIVTAYIKLIDESEDFRKKLGAAIQQDLPKSDYPTFPFRYEEGWDPRHTIFIN